MPSFIKQAFLVAAITSMALSSRLKKLDLAPSCTNIIIPVTISAQNLVIPVPASGPLTYATVQGTYNIAASYCEPQIKIKGRANTLQLLVHGITYDRNYWSGDGVPGEGFHGTQYSWIAYAGSQGYPTLSIDRLCNGLSDHPDPTAVCQVGAQVETLHQVILKARSGQLPGSANRAFTKIIYAGHSYGSVLGNNLQAKYPNDTNAGILTGWASLPMFAAVNPVFFPNIAPAALVNPVKYGTLDPNYLMANSSSAFQTMFYYPGFYDPALFSLDYSLRGTITAGEGATIEIQYATPAPDFKGPVLALTAQYDFIFCPSGPVGCGVGWSQYLKASQSLYPASKSFDGYSLQASGHCWQFHYLAPAGFAVAHAWLDLHGF